MRQKERKVILELSEHDASRLLALIIKEISQADKTWQPYWERQARNIRQSIERFSASAGPPFTGNANH